MYWIIIWQDGQRSRWPVSQFTEEYLAGLQTIASFHLE